MQFVPMGWGRIFLLLVFVACLASSLQSGVVNDFDLFDFDALSAPSYVSVPQKTCSQSSALANIPLNDPELILGFLTNAPARIQNFLSFDLYRHTYPLTRRSLFTIPSLDTLLQDVPKCCWALTIKPFLRVIPRAKFTKSSSNILSYITMFTEHDFIQDIDIDIFKNLNIPEVLPLFSKIRLEERQIGGMMFLQAHRSRWTGTLSMPILYLENNYFLTQKEIEDIQASPLFSGSGGPQPALTPSIDYSTFTEEHLINDKAGIGDLRGEIWYNFSNHEQCTAEIGLQITCPIAHVILDGIVGASDSVFCQRTRPFVDLQTMFNLYIASDTDPDAAVALATMISNLGISALDRLSAMVLNNPLGFKHFAVGPVFRAEGSLGRPDMAMQFTGDIAYYVPRNELRYFEVIKDQASFNRNYNSAQNAQENLNFLMQAATDTLFPTATLIRVHPGFTINITAALRFLRPKYTATLGYNIWGKTREHFGKISKQYGVCDPFSGAYPAPRTQSIAPLDFDAGKLTGAHQGKIFGSIASEISSKRSFDMRIGIRGDATIHGSAIGQDFTLAFDFVVDF